MTGSPVDGELHGIELSVNGNRVNASVIRILRSQVVRWARVIKTAGIEPD